MNKTAQSSAEAILGHVFIMAGVELINGRLAPVIVDD